MAAPVPVPFWTQHYEARSRTVTAERLENWYLEKNPEQAKYPYALYPTPGLTILTTVGDGPIRGIYRLGEEAYVVSGQRLYRMSSALSIVDLGEIKGTGNVYMAGNDTHVVIVTPQHAYAASLTDITQIAQEFLVGAVYQDGYALAGKLGTEQFYISDLEDLTSWTASEFSSADALADPVVSILSLRRKIMLLGRDTLEWWHNAGVADFPFVRIDGTFSEVGCLAPGSPAVLGNTAFWLGHDHQVYRADGFEVQPISPPGLSGLIESLPSPQTAWAFVYAQAGHTFYVLNFSTMTLVYDLSTGLWHRRKSHGMERWRANCHIYLWKKHLVGDSVTGNIYELDLDRFTEPRETTGAITAFAASGSSETTVTSAAHGRSNNDVLTLVGVGRYNGTHVISDVATNSFTIKVPYRGTATGAWWLNQTLRREADSPPVHNRGDRGVMHEFYVDMETGVGIDGSGQGSDPELMVSWSEDGGRTFGNEISAKLGKIGKYETQVRLFALGEFRQRTMRIAISDPVKAVIVGAWANIEPRPA